MRPAFASARRARPLLGTFVEITAEGASPSALDAAIDGAFQAVTDVHRLMSPHEPESDVSRLNREASARAVSVHPWTYEVLRMAVELHEASAGVFDVAVPTHPTEGQAVELLAGHRVRLGSPGVRIDVGGIAKGFAVDRAIDRLRDHGVPRGIVNAGGDLGAFGLDPHLIHIRDPRDPRLVLCRIEVRNEALASSGGHFDPFRSWDAEITTVIDPRTREPARSVRGVTVRAPSCMVADALTKVTMVLGEAAAPLIARYGAGALLVSTEGHVRVTRGWPGAVPVAS
jgi:thiamine biosynthesis lipoprotein